MKDKWSKWIPIAVQAIKEIVDAIKRKKDRKRDKDKK